MKPLAILCCLVNAAAADTFGLFTYTDNGTTISITGYPTSATGAISIPSTIVGKPVTSIGGFSVCSGLTSVTIPSTVTSIADSAFSGCSSLTAFLVDAANTSYSSLDGVLFNKLVTKLIQYPAGKGGSYTIPNSVKSIVGFPGGGGYAFDGCVGLTSLTIPDGVGGVYYEVWFRGCSGLTSLTVSGSTAGSQPGYSRFSSLTNLASVTISAGSTGIGTCAFAGLANLTSVTVPNSVTSIGQYAFQGCGRLTSLTIPNGVASIGSYAFQGCSGLPNVTIPNGVTNIGESAFQGCSGLKGSLTIPGGVGIIWSLAFQGCSGLTSLTISSGVTTIGTAAFSGCSGLTSVTIPASVTSILPGGAFYGCSGLISIAVDAANPNYSTADGALFNKNLTTLIRFPASKAGSYTIPSSVTSIPDNAFSGCTGLTSLTISSGVTGIPEGAFSGCTGLTSLTISSGVSGIALSAFSGCTSLTEITVDVLNSIYGSANGVLFDKALTTLTKYPAGKNGSYAIPSSVTTIGMSAFSECSGLTSVTIPSSVTSIGNSAFSGCNGLHQAIFLGNAPSIGTSVFPTTTSGFEVNYFIGKAGYTTPTWRGYPAFPVAPPQITSAAPPATARVGMAFGYTCTATGPPPPSFTVTSGALPDGLVLSTAGVISGTPTAMGIFTGTITASNGIPPDATQTFSIDTNEYRTLAASGTHGTLIGSGIYLLNTNVTLTAVPTPGYLFTGWTGNASGTANPLLVLMDADKTVTATFTPDTADDDGDDLTNFQEIVEYDTDPTKPDTDGDGAKDGADAFPLDPAETLDTDRDGTGDNADSDDDDDGYSDTDEITAHHTNPKRADSDGDGLTDPQEIETHHTNPNIADTDNDGLRDGGEFATYHTNPLIGDTDGDGFLDGYEVLTGKLPLDPLDKPALVAEARTAIEFTFSSAIGKTYRIEASTDLETWAIVESGIAGNGSQVQRFYSTRGQPKRYFRVELENP